MTKNEQYRADLKEALSENGDGVEIITRRRAEIQRLQYELARCKSESDAKGLLAEIRREQRELDTIDDLF